MKIHKLLSTKRAAAGISQAELGHRLGVNQSAVSQWERGKKKPTMRNFMRACKLLRIDPKEIWEVNL